MESPIKVNMLGEFSISYGGKIINDQLNRSKKLWTLLEYLIFFRKREVSQNELIELLWPEGEEVTNPANTLKTLLYRVRSLVEELGFEDGSQVVVYRRGAYAWSPSIPSAIDIEVFDELCAKAEMPNVSKNERLEHMMNAIRIHKGDFLPKSELESWVVPINTYYRSQYVKLVSKTIELLQDASRDEDIIDVCQKAIIIDPYEELFHLSMINSLVNTGKQQQALSHYGYVMELFFNKFGITPSEELTTLYKKVVKTSNHTEFDLRVIKDNLQEEHIGSGCFFCEYEFFKNIYQLEARTAARTGQSVFLCLITVSGISNKKLEQKLLNKTMEKLKDVISHSLRSGDVFTRYSVSQYLTMIPTTNYENGNMVMQRILKTFRKENAKSPVILKYTLQPLSPNM